MLTFEDTECTYNGNKCLEFIMLALIYMTAFWFSQEER